VAELEDRATTAEARANAAEARATKAEARAAAAEHETAQTEVRVLREVMLLKSGPSSPSPKTPTAL
jgi:hypothetical protein